MNNQINPPVCELWCDSRTPDMMSAPCDCGAQRRAADGGLWGPHRDKCTEVGLGWEKLIQRCDLSYWPETERTMLRGQDGWAFNVAVRFQSIAGDLAKSDEQYYWSPYYLLAELIKATHADMTMLEAVEAIAVAWLAGGVDWKNVVQQFKSMGIWP